VIRRGDRKKKGGVCFKHQLKRRGDTGRAYNRTFSTERIWEKGLKENNINHPIDARQIAKTNNKLTNLLWRGGGQAPGRKSGKKKVGRSFMR